MNSATLPSFWKAYRSLDERTQQRARRVYQLWADNPFHPSLHFKCINSQENIWSARASLAIRAVGVMDGDYRNVILDRESRRVRTFLRLTYLPLFRRGVTNHLTFGRIKRK